MIKAGSRVKFVSDTGVGIVRSIQGNMAYVEVEDGFEIPALISDIVEVEIEAENAAIVKIGPSDPKPLSSSAHAAHTGETPNRKQRATVRGLNNYGRVSLADDYEDDEPIDLSKFRKSFTASVAETEVDATPAAPEKAPWEVTDYLVKLLFVPVADTDKPAENADLEAWLVNDSSYTLFYNIARREQRGGGVFVRTIASGTLAADSKQQIKLYRRAELAEISTLHISLLPYKPTAFVPQAVEAFDLELHPLKFVRAASFVENDYFEAAALEFVLASSNEATDTAAPVIPTRVPKPKENTVPHKPSTKDEEVVDLHAEAILDSTDGMAPGEILKAQLARFTVALDGAVKAGRQKRIVFIHGVGKGKLRYEIEKELKRNYPKLRYQDASFAEYGYGAIMVFLK
ncbi:DUF2027 domain-containing protein [uncultured Rikenella sp.]|uniref:Smr/MutS family protein n=1 Tax=uncultured Rikenella sp. TaxID=368003 RepID=UPI0025E2BD3F|nr:DUF2027 domain-containing protein [uncultured Rikenella sp.]